MKTTSCTLFELYQLKVENFEKFIAEFNEKREQINIMISNKFIGMPYTLFQKLFEKNKFLNSQKNVNKKYFLMEIRIKSCTLSCVFKDEICTESFLFWDDANEDNAEAVSFDLKKMVSILENN